MARKENLTVGELELLRGGGEQSGRVLISAADIAGGLTSMSLQTAQQTEVVGTWNQSHKVKLKINGIEFWMPLDKVSLYLASLVMQNVVSAGSQIAESVIVVARAVNPAAISCAAAVGESAISATRQLAVNGISSQSALEAPITPIRVFDEDDIACASAIGSPSAERIGCANGDAVACASSIGDVALTPIRAINSADIVSSTRVRQPDILRIETWPVPVDDIASASSVGESTITRTRALTENSIASASSVGTPTVAVV